MATYHGELIGHKEGYLIPCLRTFRVRVEEHEQRLEHQPYGVDVPGALVAASASFIFTAFLAQAISAESRYEFSQRPRRD